jgi:hypothetical protein
MDIQDAVEMIIDQVVNGEWGNVDGDDFSRLRAENYIPDADAVIPYSRMLCTKDVSRARSELRGKVAEIRRALDGLEAFLDAIDAAEGEAAAHGHPEWVPLIALLKALSWPNNTSVLFRGGESGFVPSEAATSSKVVNNPR